ncbi:hypothetical protein DFH29DRAFT_998995 [Suillus ampliporus]|nr:hypothetical protein DFH29DRAFT_998995 [Suillus ampliporus]
MNPMMLHRNQTSTQVDLRVRSYDMKPPIFFARDNYDVRVKLELSKRTMDVGTDFIWCLFPSSKVLAESKGICTWDNLITTFEAQHPPLYNKKEQRWENLPDLCHWMESMEVEMAAFINKIAAVCGHILGVKPTRFWTAAYSTASLLGHDVKRKPDLILLSDLVADWRCVRAVGEMKSSKSEKMKVDIFNQLASKTSIIFASQDNQEFVLSLGFIQDGLELFKVDRGGAITVQCLPINSHWKLFLCVIISFAITCDEIIGYDPSINTAPIHKGEIRYMRLQEHPWNADLARTLVTMTSKILSTIFISNGIVGRGTCILHVENVITGDWFIMKDTWHDPKRRLTEGQILQALKGIKNIPVFVAEVVVSQYSCSQSLVSRKITLDGARGGIECLQHELATGMLDDRVHLQLQTKASNTKLVTNFKNREELVVAILCYIKVTSHKEAYEKRHILHRDIHLGNIYIHESTGADTRKSPTGMLGDWGFAECYDPSILQNYHVSKPSELPELSATTPNMPEYSDSEDEKFFNPQEDVPAPSIPRRQSGRRSKKTPKRARSPTLVISQPSDLEVPTEVADSDMDAVYRDFNPWHTSSMEENLLRTGAASFVAIELLFQVNGISPQHSPMHDLESFFYAIIVILMLFIEPGVKRSTEYWKDTGLEHWWYPHDWNLVAKWKYSTMKADFSFDDSIMGHVSGYFDCWKPLIHELRHAIFGTMLFEHISSAPFNCRYKNTHPITYNTMISILQEMVQLGKEQDILEGENPTECKAGLGDQYWEEDERDMEKKQQGWGSQFFLKHSEDLNGCPIQSDVQGSSSDLVFTPVETFKITDMLDEVVVQVYSDIVQEEYPPDPYHLQNPSPGGDMPNFVDPSLCTSDLPTSSSTMAVGPLPSHSGDPHPPVQERPRRTKDNDHDGPPPAKKSHKSSKPSRSETLPKKKSRKLKAGGSSAAGPSGAANSRASTPKHTHKATRSNNNAEWLPAEKEAIGSRGRDTASMNFQGILKVASHRSGQR